VGGYSRPTTNEAVMNQTQHARNKTNSIQTLNAWGLILCLGALPFLGGVAGCASSSRYTQTTSERNEDHGTSSRVSAALADDPQHKYFEGVKVETFKDVVQLSGFVNTRTLKDRAGDIARDAAGGRQVRNNITVKQ
jgi:hyperosmotically inducible protein